MLATFRHLIFLHSLIILLCGFVFIDEALDLSVSIAIVSIFRKNEVSFNSLVAYVPGGPCLAA